LYIEEKYSVYYNPQFILTSNIYLSEYEIRTDNSLMPWSENHIDKGIFAIAPPNSQTKPFQTII
jgi:hypothetical protein